MGTICMGYSYWDKVILNFLNGRTRLHDVYLININLKLIKLYLNIQIKLN